MVVNMIEVIKLFLIPCMILLGCGSVKNNPAAKTDSLHTALPVEQTIKDTLPLCIKRKIDSFKVMQVHEKPQRVIEYRYNGKRVYYVVMPCCDFFNEVFDEDCKFIGAPDGGFTGKGDGKLPGFFKEATNEKLIWEPVK